MQTQPDSLTTMQEMVDKLIVEVTEVVATYVPDRLQGEVIKLIKTLTELSQTQGEMKQLVHFRDGLLTDFQRNQDGSANGSAN